MASDRNAADSGQLDAAAVREVSGALGSGAGAGAGGVGASAGRGNVGTKGTHLLAEKQTLFPREFN